MVRLTTYRMEQINGGLDAGPSAQQHGKSLRRRLVELHERSIADTSTTPHDSSERNTAAGSANPLGCPGMTPTLNRHNWSSFPSIVRCQRRRIDAPAQHLHSRANQP